jgi:hypothetical protein
MTGRLLQILIFENVQRIAIPGFRARVEEGCILGVAAGFGGGR